MIRTEIKAYSENEMRNIERNLKETGYTKTNDCMWVTIYTKLTKEKNIVCEAREIVLIREF